MTFLSSNSDEWSFLTQKIRLFFFFLNLLLQEQAAQELESGA